MAKKEDKLLFEKKFAFDIWDKAMTKKAFDFCEGYKEFLSVCKTERLCVKWAENAAKEKGFKRLEHIGRAKQKGFDAPLYSINRGKAIILAKPGKRSVTDGLRLILAHIDSPRLDLKMKPLYESEHLAFLKTHYYAGIKKYQWTALPLAMYGTIAKTDGSITEVAIGDNKSDPIFMITDLAPHSEKLQAEKKIEEAVPAETLNVIVGNNGQKGKDNEKDLVKKNVLRLLNEKYGVKEEDLLSADLELVPAGSARDLGFDRSLVAAYGQDDRVCSYAALQAGFLANKPEFASLTVLIDKEDTGSEGSTSIHSNFVADFISELLFLETGNHDENVLRDVFVNSKAISADVTAAYDPDYADVFDANNTARIGAGVVVEKYTGARGKYFTSDANAEYVAHIRNILNNNRIIWQSGGVGKVDVGGGGTMAMYLARFNMDVIDISVALFSMHAPFEIASKADIYSAYLAYKAFFESK